MRKREKTMQKIHKTFPSGFNRKIHMKNYRIFFFVLFIYSLYIILSGVSANETSFENISSEKQVYSDNYPGIFEIRIVDPKMLSDVIYNAGSQAVPLKVERGLYIGLVTPGVVYLRGDLNEDDFPQNESKKVKGNDLLGEHLIDITFGRDNAKTDLFDNTQDYLIWLDAMYQQSDVQDIQKDINLINDLSQTVTFEDEEIGLPSYQPNYQPIPYLFYKISIVDHDLMKDLLDDRNSGTEQILKNKKGDSVALVRKDHLYLLSDLTGDERSYYLLRGLLFSMGFHGESSNPESFFYSENTNAIKLSDLDKEAIRLMYGGRLQSGLDVEGIKKSLGLAKND